MSKSRLAQVSLAVLCVALADAAYAAPTAEYWLSVETASGMMAGSAGMQGGAAHKLTLDLGSTRPASGAPSAAHTAPAALGVGPVLPLLTPKKEGASTPKYSGVMPPKPNMKMVLFWGCGGQAKAGQPVVIDLSKTGATAVGWTVKPMQPPSPERSATYGGWPRDTKQRTELPAASSLVGDHAVKGNYSPDIAFTLKPGQDFLGPLNMQSDASGKIGWSKVAGARAYLATATGVDGDTFYMWSSSEARPSSAVNPDFISSSEITRLLAAKALMPATATSCAVPKGFIDAVPQAMVQLSAYGEEVNISQPRPADAKPAWTPDWTVKARFRSHDGGMLGMNLPQMPGAMGGMGGMAGGMGAMSGGRPAMGAAVGAAAGMMGGGMMGGMGAPGMAGAGQPGMGGMVGAAVMSGSPMGMAAGLLGGALMKRKAAKDAAAAQAGQDAAAAPAPKKKGLGGLLGN